MSINFIVLGYRTDDDGITHLKVSRVEGDQAQPPVAKTKREVVKDIRTNNSTYYTAIKEDDDFLTKNELRIVEANGEYYLRTDDKQQSKDDLQGLPKF